MRAFLFHPLVYTTRVGQFIIAVSIFFYAALMSISDTPGSIHPLVLHLTGNILLICSAWTAFLNRIQLWKIFVLTLFLSSAAELGQSMTDSRTSDPVDLAINIVGLLIGLGICWLGERLLKKFEWLPA